MKGVLTNKKGGGGQLTDNSLFIFPSFIKGCGKALEMISDKSA